MRKTRPFACAASLLTLTNRIVGRCAASQIASASAAPFFWRFTNGLTYFGAISYGLNMHHYPYHYDNSASYATLWTRTTAMSRMRRASQMVVSTDTQEWRWFARSSTNPSPPILYYSNPNLPNSWASADTQAPNATYGRHKGGSNLLFADGHVAFSATLPADVSARTVFLRLEDIL